MFSDKRKRKFASLFQIATYVALFEIECLWHTLGNNLLEFAINPYFELLLFKFTFTLLRSFQLSRWHSGRPEPMWNINNVLEAEKCTFFWPAMKWIYRNVKIGTLQWMFEWRVVPVIYYSSTRGCSLKKVLCERWSHEVKPENLYFSIFLLFWDFLSRTGSPGAPGEPVLSTWGARLSWTSFFKWSKQLMMSPLLKQGEDQNT